MSFPSPVIPLERRRAGHDRVAGRSAPSLIRTAPRPPTAIAPALREGTGAPVASSRSVSTALVSLVWIAPITSFAPPAGAAWR